MGNIMQKTLYNKIYLSTNSVKILQSYLLILTGTNIKTIRAGTIPISKLLNQSKFSKSK